MQLLVGIFVMTWSILHWRFFPHLPQSLVKVLTVPTSSLLFLPLWGRTQSSSFWTWDGLSGSHLTNRVKQKWWWCIKWGHKKVLPLAHYLLALSLSLSLALSLSLSLIADFEEAGCHVLRTLRQSHWTSPHVRNWGPLPTAMSMRPLGSRSSSPHQALRLTAALAQSLTAPSGRHWAKTSAQLLPIPNPQKLWK